MIRVKRKKSIRVHVYTDAENNLKRILLGRGLNDDTFLNAIIEEANQIPNFINMNTQLYATVIIFLLELNGRELTAEVLNENTIRNAIDQASFFKEEKTDFDLAQNKLIAEFFSYVNYIVVQRNIINSAKNSQ
jgi:hypothetical protein